MTAPSTTARTTPTGIKLSDGYQSLIAFERDPDINLWEKSVTPPGYEGGDAIDDTTMHNTTYRTFASRELITLTESTFTCMYDPDAYTSIINFLLNQEGSITVHFPDGSTLDFYGYLKTFTPSELVEGETPEAEVTIVPTNREPGTSTEESAVLTSVAGT
ncbi:hypothetical protein OAG36_00640 [bacterium]|nr:hypothetical protein [bacterium]